MRDGDYTELDNILRETIVLGHLSIVAAPL